MCIRDRHLGDDIITGVDILKVLTLWDQLQGPLASAGFILKWVGSSIALMKGLPLAHIDNGCLKGVLGLS